MMGVMDLDDTIRDLDRAKAEAATAADYRDCERIRVEIVEAARIRAQHAEIEIEQLLRPAGQYGASVDDIAARWGIAIEAANDVIKRVKADGIVQIEETEINRWRLRR